MTTNDLGGWLRKAAAWLSSESEHPLLESQVLAAEVLQRDRTWIAAHPEYLLSEAETSQLGSLLKRRKQGEPLPYILGHWGFFGRDFVVSHSVLIPRPETELLVETALNWLRMHPERRQGVDVGTGSGCIAITLALEIADLKMIAVDISPEALKVANENLKRASLDQTRINQAGSVSRRVSFVQSDLLTQVDGQFDLVCANLPYIPSEKLQRLAVAQYEPRLALDGGANGLLYIERLLKALNERLIPGGLALFEIEAEQGVTAAYLARKIISDADIAVKKDLAGLDRLLLVAKHG